MNPLRDEDLFNNRAFHQAVRTHRATLTGAPSTRSRRWPIGWLISAIVIGVLLIVLIGQLYPAG
jgi:hypothetical protein